MKGLNKKAMAISQIIILLIGIIAISYAFGSEVKTVKAETSAAAANIPTSMPSPASYTPVSGISSTTNYYEYGIAPPSQFFSNWWSNLIGGVSNLIWNAGVAAGLVAIGYGLAYLNPENAAEWQSWGWWAGGGFGVGSLLGYITGAAIGTSWAGPLSWIVGGAGFLIGTIIFLITYTETASETIVFNCQPWVPTTGGADCSKCGEGNTPCTKYKCESLGQGCELINEGTSNAICTWFNRNDVSSPVITPWKEALPNQNDWKYTPDNTISPPDRGVRIVYSGKDATSDGCAPAFSVISFGVSLDKPATCRISKTRIDSITSNFYNKMPFSVDEGLPLYNHSISIRLPGIANAEEEGMNIDTTGKNQVYIRCNSTNGVVTTANFVFKFCLSTEPDHSAPNILSESIPDGSPIQYGQSSTPISIYLDEPADCKWTKDSGKSYDDMDGTFDNCAKSINDVSYIGGQEVYACSGTLTGLNNNANNTFYFSCKDQPILGADKQNLRNTINPSVKYTLAGTRPLVISSVSPEDGSTARGASNQVDVNLQATTSAGYQNGGATCYYNELCYNPVGNANNFIQFFYPSGTIPFSQHQHSQDLMLSTGSYDCSIKCCDAGLNCDTEETRYSVATDNQPPRVLRAYYESPDVTIITDEKAQCVYDTKDCSYNFGDGLAMTDSDDGLTHNTEWQAGQTLYIKCKDSYGNEPQPQNTCTIIAKPISL